MQSQTVECRSRVRVMKPSLQPHAFLGPMDGFISVAEFHTHQIQESDKYVKLT